MISKKEKLSAAIGNVDEQYIEEALNYKGYSNARHRKFPRMSAACIAVLIISLFSITALAISFTSLSWRDLFGVRQTVIGDGDEASISSERIIGDGIPKDGLNIDIQKILSDERALYILYTLRIDEGEKLSSAGRFADFQMYFPDKMMSGAYQQFFLDRNGNAPANELGGVIYANWQADMEARRLTLMFSDWQELEMLDAVKVDFDLAEIVRSAGTNARLPALATKGPQEYLWQPAGGQTEFPNSSGVYIDNAGWENGILQIVLRGPIGASESGSSEWTTGQNWYFVDTRTGEILYPDSLGFGCAADDIDETLTGVDWQYYWRYLEVEKEDLPFLELYSGGKDTYVTKIPGTYKAEVEVPVTMKSELLTENIALNYNGAKIVAKRIECSKITIGIYFSEYIDSTSGILDMFEALDAGGNRLDCRWVFTADADGNGCMVWAVFDEPQELGTIKYLSYNGNLIYSEK